LSTSWGQAAMNMLDTEKQLVYCLAKQTNKQTNKQTKHKKKASPLSHKILCSVHYLTGCTSFSWMIPQSNINIHLRFKFV
jgi:hypothetical protein